MIHLCCNTIPSSTFLSDISAISQVIIAAGSLCLAIYIFFYQFSKDRKIEIESARLNEQNIKLQWFKELIIQPNIEIIVSFYTNLHTIKDKINSNDLTTEEKEDINEFVKAELSIIRKSFVDILLHVDKNFATLTLSNLDELVDGITNAIFDDDLKLKNTSVYEKNIGQKISYSKNSLISQIYNYKGLS